MRAAQPALCASHRRYAEAKSQMSGQPELSRVGDSLSVAQEHVGLLPEFAVGLDKRRDFPK